jgi:hypothetical protein
MFRLLRQLATTRISQRFAAIVAVCIVAFTLCEGIPLPTYASNLNATTFFSSPPNTPTVRIATPKTGKLLDGAVVKVAVGIVCSGFIYLEGSSTSNVEVLQTNQGIVNGAFGTVTPALICDNAPHQYLAEVTLPIGATPFHRGQAVVDVSVTQCGETNQYIYTCAEGNATHPIQLQ